MAQAGHCSLSRADDCSVSSGNVDSGGKSKGRVLVGAVGEARDRSTCISVNIISLCLPDGPHSQNSSNSPVKSLV